METEMKVSPDGRATLTNLYRCDQSSFDQLFRI